MYCKKCGKEKVGNWKICPWCGNEYDLKEQEKGYVLFSRFSGIEREKINKILSAIYKVIEFWTVLKIFIHINHEMQAAEGYNLFIYIIRFINMCAPYAVLMFITKEIIWVMSLKKEQIYEQYSGKKVMVAEGIHVCLGLLGWFIWMNPSDKAVWKTYAVAAGASFFEFLWEIRWVPILLFASDFLKSKIEEKMMIEKNKNEEGKIDVL